MANNKLLLVYLLVTFSVVLTSYATTYMVGDTSGWDISTNLDSWPQNKIFNVGDILVFQYSSTHSVSELKREDFDSCNTSNALDTFSNGNTTVTLSKPGMRYFVCGNKLHCLGGMKLQVNVAGDASSPIASPEAQPDATLPQPSSKSNNPATVIPTSTGFSCGGRDSLVVAFLGFVATVLSIMVQV